MDARPDCEGEVTRIDHTHGEAGDDPDVAPVEPVAAPTGWLERGDTIGRYVVLECLGIGGMGIVYAAWDPKLDRKLAIKLVRTRGRVGETRGRTRLLREAQALARLRHPNVISVHDVGTHRGRVFVAMEHIEGTTVQRWLGERQRSFAEVLDVFLQAGRGLAAAHRAGLIHRDFKPENVMLGSDRRAMVLDFGIARTPLSADEVARTESNLDLDALPDPPDPQDDEAALDEPAAADDPHDGLTTRPRTRASSRSTLDLREQARASDSMAGLLAQARAEDSLIAAIAMADDGVLQPVSSVQNIPLDELDQLDQLDQLAPLDDAAEPVDVLTRQGAVVGTPSYMSPEQHRGQPLDGRSDQFSYCVAMWEALTGERPFGEGPRQKLLARMRLGQLRPFARRDVPRHVVAALRRGLSWSRADRFPTMEALLEALNPRSRETPRASTLPIAALVTALALVVIAIASTTFGLPPSAPAPTCPAGADEIATVWNPARAERIEAALRVSAGEQTSSIWVRADEQLERWTSTWIDAHAHACHEHHVEQRSSAGLLELQIACLDRQRDDLDRLLALFEHPDPGLRDGMLESIAELPDPTGCLAGPGLRPGVPQPSSARERQRIAELRREALDLEQMLRLGRYEAGRERAYQLQLAAEQIGYPPMLAEALLIHGTFLARSGRASEAEATLLRAASMAASVGEPDLQTRAQIVLAGLLGARGLDDEALRWLEVCEGLANQTRDPLRVRVAIATTRATIAWRRGDLETAEARFEHARSLLEAGDRPPGPQLPLVLQSLGLVASARGQHERALAFHRRALVLFEEQLGNEHRLVARARMDLASSLRELGQPEAALAEYRRALELFERSEGPRIDAAIARSHVGTTLGLLDRCDEARELLDRAWLDVADIAPGTLEQASLLEARASLCEWADAQAIEWIEQARAIRERLQDADHPDLLRNQLAHALARFAAGHHQLALVELAQVQPRADELDADERATTLAVEGLILHALGRRSEAAPLLEQASSEATPTTPFHRRVVELRLTDQ